MSKTKSKSKRLTAEELQAATDAFVAYLRRGGGFGAAVHYLRAATEQLQKEPLEVEHAFEGDCEFASAIIGGGSLVQTCDFCGVTYFATWSDSDFDEGELEELRKLAREPKNKYVEWGDVSSVSYGMLDGRTYVYGCDCKAAAAYEMFVWNHRHSIADYLKKRAADERAKANVIERLAAAADAVNSPTPI